MYYLCFYTINFNMSKERDEKLKALQLTVDRLEKTYGKGSVMKLGDKPIVDEVDKISTGSISLDIALGVGGFPKGRVIEIYGPLRSMLSLNPKKMEVLLHLLMQSMPLIAIMQKD